MSYEEWAEHHQFALWTCGILLTSGIPQLKRVYGVVRRIPSGFSAIRRASRRADLQKLEAYANDPQTLTRAVVRSLVFAGFVNFIFAAAMTRVDEIWPPPTIMKVLPHATGVEKVVVRIWENQAVFTSVLCVLSLQLLLVLWDYRNPEERLRRLRKEFPTQG